MTSLSRTLTATAIVLLVGCLTMSYALQAPTQDELWTFEGQLLDVDLDAMTISVRADDGTEMQFRFSNATEITGSDQDIQGLANSPGTNLRIHYVEVPEANEALRLEVLPGSEIQ